MLLYLVRREKFPNHLTGGQGKFPKQKGYNSPAKSFGRENNFDFE